MARRGALLVLLILITSGAVGALAGYRMHVTSEFHENAEPLDVNLTVLFPDGVNHTVNVTVQGSGSTALGALRSGVEDVYRLHVREFEGLGYYVYAIGDHEADGRCGWLYGINGTEPINQGETAANEAWLEDGDHIYWFWGCV